MSRIVLFLFFVSFSCNSFSQNSAAADTAQIAKVNVMVRDMKGKPTKGEQILFRSEKTQKVASGRSDATGKFSLQLPVGDKYIITVKSLTDSTRYGVLDIPALGPDEYYTEPFNVDVKYKVATSYTLDNVHFDFGKASLRPESFPELGELVNYLKYKEDIRVEIAGHTDNVGNAAENLKLSQQRAEAIRSYVIKKGIAAARVIAKGYGATQPVADNSTEQGRQLNRRTEVRVL